MDDTERSSLDVNNRDKLVIVAKAITGAVPYLGGFFAELLDSVVPKLRFERVVDFIKMLDSKVSELDHKLEYFQKNIVTEEGIDLFEESMLQASRAVSLERKERLVSILEKSLSEEDLRYEETKKILNIFRDLTDPEIIWLIFYSLHPCLGKGPHSEWVEKHPEVLYPLSRDSTATEEELEKAALQDSYKDTLKRLGLITINDNGTRITTLGSMLVKYMGVYQKVC